MLIKVCVCVSVCEREVGEILRYIYREREREKCVRMCVRGSEEKEVNLKRARRGGSE